jgi:hypothetical protein
VNEPKIAAFPASKLAPFLRAVADPEGTGDLSPEEETAIKQVESNMERRAQEL